jgi:hypothetical protein
MNYLFFFMLFRPGLSLAHALMPCILFGNLGRHRVKVLNGSEQEPTALACYVIALDLVVNEIVW